MSISTVISTILSQEGDPRVKLHPNNIHYYLRRKEFGTCFLAFVTLAFQLSAKLLFQPVRKCAVVEPLIAVSSRDSLSPSFLAGLQGLKFE